MARKILRRVESLKYDLELREVYLLSTSSFSHLARHQRNTQAKENTIKANIPVQALGNDSRAVYSEAIFLL
jgi:hypothetical protein